jgi:hypothetical protein
MTTQLFVFDIEHQPSIPIVTLYLLRVQVSKMAAPQWRQCFLLTYTPPQWDQMGLALHTQVPLPILTGTFAEWTQFSSICFEIVSPPPPDLLVHYQAMSCMYVTT